MTDPVQNTFDHARSWSVISTPVNANTFLTFLKIRGVLKKGGQNIFFCFCYRRTQALRGILKATEMLSPAWILTPIWNNWVRTFVNILMGVKYIMSTAKTQVYVVNVPTWCLPVSLLLTLNKFNQLIKFHPVGIYIFKGNIGNRNNGTMKTLLMSLICSESVTEANLMTLNSYSILVKCFCVDFEYWPASCPT